MSINSFKSRCAGCEAAAGFRDGYCSHGREVHLAVVGFGVMTADAMVGALNDPCSCTPAFIAGL